jgi:hypothetical protein
MLAIIVSTKYEISEYYSRMIIKEKFPAQPKSDIIVSGALSKKKDRSYRSDERNQVKAERPSAVMKEVVKHYHSLDKSSDHEHKATSLLESKSSYDHADEIYQEYDAQNKEYVKSLTPDQIKEEIDDLSKRLSSKALDFLKERGASRGSATANLSAAGLSADHSPTASTSETREQVKELRKRFKESKRYDLQSRLIVDKLNHESYYTHMKSLVTKQFHLSSIEVNDKERVTRLCTLIHSFLLASQLIMMMVDVDCDDMTEVEVDEDSRSHSYGSMVAEGLSVLQVMDVSEITFYDLQS